MDKHRKAVIELCAAIELAKSPMEERELMAMLKLVGDIKASFNHSMQYRYEQHLARLSRVLGIIREGVTPTPEGEDEKNGQRA